jgi:hypothetical protein
MVDNDHHIAGLPAKSLEKPYLVSYLEVLKKSATHEFSTDASHPRLR